MNTEPKKNDGIETVLPSQPQAREEEIENDRDLTKFGAQLAQLGFQCVSPGRYSFRKALPPGINAYTLTIRRSQRGSTGEYSAILRSDPLHQELDYVPPSPHTLAEILEEVSKRVDSITETKEF